jgi:hypothetical protein
MDITATLAPKSDQMNADDLIVGPRTITVTKVDVALKSEQPVAIHFDGDNGRPWRPCKSMRRVLAEAWGPDSSHYVGRGITIFREPGAMYGGQQVGGIRLSHLSHIDGPLTVMLTASRGKRLPYKVLPLQAPSPAAPAPAAAAAPPAEDLIQAAEAACRRSGLTSAGIAAFVLELTQGDTSDLSAAPPEALARIVRQGVSPQTVKRCNAKPAPEPPAPNSEPTPSSPNLEASSPNLGPSSLTLEATSGPERLSPATEPGTAERLPQGRTTVAADPQPASAPASAASAAGRRSAPAPVRRSDPAAAPGAEAPIPGLVD